MNLAPRGLAESLGRNYFPGLGKQDAQELKFLRREVNLIRIAEESPVRAEAESAKTVLKPIRVKSRIRLCNSHSQIPNQA